ncbi:DUF2384 domain-containing protein [Shewanella inventionis]|uniref:DUF2384 domain-containing protein n=1 Tax=Shewanella inventionis TaxID=1738770 RepID=A0ABQ1IWJ9_9GAMM|nr:hypothetical protein [Shewanella inventionis]GGB53007.1 DUF2384 domain-containing protein [Shewanella inventionis]
MSVSKTNPNTIDFSDPKISEAGFKSACNIMMKWGCKVNDMQSILRISKSRFFEYKSGKQTGFVLDKDQLTRVSYILNIHSALRVYFSNPDNVYGFMNMVNGNPFFSGRKPIDIIKGGNIIDIYEVFCRIDNMRSGGR